MDIGKRVRNLRTEKLMTQTELAGGEITRNMLSQIENGSAMPSLGTVIYLAKRLGVSAGYLIAEESEEPLYRKNLVMGNIKKAYTDKSYTICRDLCLNEITEHDDEIELILSFCCINIAIEGICRGQLRSACGDIDSALIHAGRTMYDTSAVKSMSQVLYSLLRGISPTLDCLEIEDGDKKYSAGMFDDAFCKYVIALESLESDCFDPNDPRERLYQRHTEARRMMREGNFDAALKTFDEIARAEEALSKIMLYFMSIDMEICCREVGDFKGAYEYSQNKISMLENMLSSI